jgi:hypothetical protein
MLRARRSFLVVFCPSSHLASDLLLEWQIRCLLMTVGLQSKKKSAEQATFFGETLAKTRLQGKTCPI